MKITAPEWLPTDAVPIFNRTVELLGKAALELDESLIADFAKAQSDVIRLEKIVMFEGETAIGKSGLSYLNPNLTILMSRRKDLAMLRNDLKLTPRSRNSPIKTSSASNLKDAMRAP